MPVQREGFFSRKTTPIILLYLQSIRRMDTFAAKAAINAEDLTTPLPVAR